MSSARSPTRLRYNLRRLNTLVHAYDRVYMDTGELVRSQLGAGSLLSACAVFVQSVLGAGLLAFPSAFKDAGIGTVGITEAILLILVLGGLRIISRCAVLCDAPTYQQMVRRLAGPRWAAACEGATIVLIFGACVAYLQVVTDQINSIIVAGAASSSSGHLPSQTALTGAVAAVGMLLCMIPNISGLSLPSLLSMISMVFVAALVSVNYFLTPALPAYVPVPPSSSSSSSSSLLQRQALDSLFAVPPATSVPLFASEFKYVVLALPILCFGFQGHIAAVPLLHELHRLARRSERKRRRESQLRHDKAAAPMSAGSTRESLVRPLLDAASEATGVVGDAGMSPSPTLTPPAESTGGSSTPGRPVRAGRERVSTPGRLRLGRRVGALSTASLTAVRSFDTVCALGIAICVVIYNCTGIFGVLTFGTGTKSDILLNFANLTLSGAGAGGSGSQSHAMAWAIVVAKACVALSVVTTYTILHFCARTVVLGMLAPLQARLRLALGETIPSGPDAALSGSARGGGCRGCCRCLVNTSPSAAIMYIGVTVLWSAGAFLVAVTVPSVGVVIQLTGNLASLFMFVFPGICLASAAAAKEEATQAHAQGASSATLTLTASSSTEPSDRDGVPQEQEQQQQEGAGVDNVVVDVQNVAAVNRSPWMDASVGGTADVRSGERKRAETEDEDEDDDEVRCMKNCRRCQPAVSRIYWLVGVGYLVLGCLLLVIGLAVTLSGISDCSGRDANSAYYAEHCT